VQKIIEVFTREILIIARNYSGLMELTVVEDWWNSLTPAKRSAVNQAHGIPNWDIVAFANNPMQYTGKGDYSVNVAPKRFGSLRLEAQDTVCGFYQLTH